ncbi:hypothetical protein [Paludibacterium yongneupense]|uniref:hypothetical protein n=1 Tax=Paludibacterium yongneupense TaxID=400061 RepID=UPI00041520A3|nr:hypothetical protein [Paludibacterium yongneupense]
MTQIISYRAYALELAIEEVQNNWKVSVEIGKSDGKTLIPDQAFQRLSEVSPKSDNQTLNGAMTCGRTMLARARAMVDAYLEGEAKTG